MLAPGRFERRVAATGNVTLAAALVLFAALAYWQVFRTDLANHAGNPRVLAAFSDPARGRILDRDGNVLAETTAGVREYEGAPAPHVLGYLDARYGTTGVELAFNGVLAGLAGGSVEEAFNAEFRRQARQGLDVRLTIDSRLQALATSALGARAGAVVAIDPRSGEVLVMVSFPAYDPSTLGSDGEALLADPSAPLLNRATQGLYPPGSTFKVVTAISALEHKVITPDTIVICPGEIVIDGFPISCRNTAQGVGTYPFRDAFAFSVNAIFGQVGVDLGWSRLLETAERLGFGSAIGFTIETAPTQLFQPGADRTRALLAVTAFGQGQLLVTPLQMAALVAAVANGGELVEPHLGLDARDGDATAFSLGGGGTRRVIDAGIAHTIRDMMVAVTDNGQASGVAIAGVKVAGKTGTAESGQGTSHAWFIGFAPADDPVIVVAVVVEDGGRGGEVAAPIAGSIMKAALGR